MSVPDEVAADFRDALQDLKLNSRPEISNLTIIAKENTEHAQAISRELENHIRTTRPEWKLPALYVLDSIVKNVGTPYTVYLGRNLYRTFMEAYMIMSPKDRRNMEGLLKTWKQPVPESMDPRPVFQPEVTRDIENALIKFQTAAVQAQAQSQRLPHGLPARPMSNSAWRDTPTPPQNMPQYAAPSDPRLRQPYPPTTQYNQYPSNTATPPTQFPASHQFQPPVTSGDLESLKVEVANVIAATKATWASNFGDVNVQTQLKALLDLQRVLIEQPLLPQQLGVIRNQIRALSSPPASASVYPPSVSAPPPNIRTPVQVANPAYPPTSTPMNLAQILASVRPPGPPSFAPSPAPPAPIATPSLADILRSVSTPGPLSATSASMLPMFPPPFTAAPPPIPTSTPAPTANYSATANLAQLLASINKPPATQHTPVQSTPVPQLFQQPPAATPAPVNTDWLMNALKGIPSLPGVGAPLQSAPAVTAPMARQIPAPTNSRNVIELTTASMKQPRLHMISKLYEAIPNICSTCGRRFEGTPQGKEKKARHMDWHFKVKDPDAAKRGVHRSWYIGEKEWIDYREVDETSPDQGMNASKVAAAPRKEAKDRYVLVPADAALQHAPCPICQEKWAPTFHQEANDFVWTDAIQVNGRIYHGSCWEEYSKAAGIGTPSTPDSVLGKRKAEIGTPASGKKVRAF